MTSPIYRSLMIELGERDGSFMVTISAVVRSGDQTAAKVRSAASYRDMNAAYRAVRDFCEMQVIEGAEEQVKRVVEAPEHAPWPHADAPF